MGWSETWKNKKLKKKMKKLSCESELTIDARQGALLFVVRKEQVDWSVCDFTPSPNLRR